MALSSLWSSPAAVAAAWPIRFGGLDWDKMATIMARSPALQTALFLLAALVGVGAARANPQPMTAGSHPRPTTDTQVAIAREELLIEISRRLSAVPGRIGGVARSEAAARLAPLQATTCSVRFQAVSAGCPTHLLEAARLPVPTNSSRLCQRERSIGANGSDGARLVGSARARWQHRGSRRRRPCTRGRSSWGKPAARGGR
jgi:hypothetical protein